MRNFLKKLFHRKKEEKPFFLIQVGSLTVPASRPQDLMHFCALYLCAQNLSAVAVSTGDIKTMWLGANNDDAQKAFVFQDKYIVFVGECKVYETDIKQCPFKKKAE